MSDTKKPVTEQTRLMALGMFTVAVQHYKKVREMEKAMSELLGYPESENFYMGCISDEMYKDDGGDFASGFRKEGFFVEKQAAK